MSLRKRGDTWWVDFTAPNGERIRCSAGTSDKVLAQEYHDKLKADSWRIHRLGEKPDYTWQEAVVKWLREKSHKASLDKDRTVFRWVDPYLHGKRLRDINRDLLWQILEAKAAESTRANANRYMAVIRALLRRARDEWEWVENVPKAPMYSVSSKRIRWLTPEQADKLLSLLPPHQEAMARFGLATGLRQRNVCRLQWSDVDLKRRCCWVHADQAKARRAIPVPLNVVAMDVLAGQAGQHDDFVFVFKGQPVWQVNTKAWRRAVKAAGLEDFRWHDLRHTWASWHVQAGTPLHVLQEMGGWSTMEMVQRYAHLSAGHLADHAERIARPMAQSRHSGLGQRGEIALSH